jgi:large subunit ribosomal protein L20
MARVKGGVTSLKRRHGILKMTKGYRFGRSTKKRQAKEAIFHAGKYAFAHRKDKKNDFRKLWNTRINAGLEVISPAAENGARKISYSKLMGSLTKQKILINRKMLAELAQTEPATFARIVAKAS